jgi:N-acetyl-gamma-glutamylphosphate reductase
MIMMIMMLIIIIIIIIIGETGATSKSLRKYLSNRPVKHEIKVVQKQTYWALHTYY